MVEWKAVSNTATCGTSGRTRRASSSAFSAGVLCNGAISARSATSCSTSASMTTGDLKRAPPWTMRWPTASTPPSSSAYDSILRRVSSVETRSSFRLVEPALTTRTSRAVNLQPMEPDVPDRLLDAVGLAFA